MYDIDMKNSIATSLGTFSLLERSQKPNVFQSTCFIVNTFQIRFGQTTLHINF